MVNMGVAITLLIKKWADAHSLTVREKEADYISGTNATVVKIVGMTSMTLLLVPTLELDMANVAVCSGEFYQACWDVICSVGTIKCSAWLPLYWLVWTS